MNGPLHTAVVAGKPVRFFRTPLADGKADLAWVAFNDLLDLSRLTRKEAGEFVNELRQAWPDSSRTIAVTDGLAVIVPGALGCGLIEALAENGLAPVSLPAEFDAVLIEAMKALTQGMSPPAVSTFMWAACRRWEHAQRRTVGGAA